MSLLSRDLKIHLLPENSIELIANSSSTPLNSHNTLGSSTTSGFVEVSVTKLDRRGTFQFSAKLSSVALPCITGQSTVVPFRVCPNCVLGVRRIADVRRLAEEFFTDPTLRYLVSFLLRNLVGYNIECLPRPFKVWWSPLLSSWDWSLLSSPLCVVNFSLWSVKTLFNHPYRRLDF